eukprot:877130-Lingulodinium_polyedra.AAC.1
MGSSWAACCARLRGFAVLVERAAAMRVSCFRMVLQCAAAWPGAFDLYRQFVLSTKCSVSLYARGRARAWGGGHAIARGARSIASGYLLDVFVFCLSPGAGPLHPIRWRAQVFGPT